MNSNSPQQQNNKRNVRAITHPSTTLTLTPWQECVQIFRGLKRRYEEKQAPQQQESAQAEGQSEEFEIQGTSSEFINGSNIPKNEPLFDDPQNTMFCISDDDDDDFVDLV